MYERALLTPAIFLIPALPTFLLATLVLLSIAVPLPWMGEVAVAPGQESAVGPIPTPWCSCGRRGWPRPLGSPVAEPAALPFVAPFLLPVPAGSFRLKDTWVGTDHVSSQVILVDGLIVALVARHLLLHKFFIMSHHVPFTFLRASGLKVTVSAFKGGMLVDNVQVFFHGLLTFADLSTEVTFVQQSNMRHLLVGFDCDFFG